MLQDIRAYLEYLEKHCGLSVSIHTGTEAASGVIDALAPYNIHRSEFCLSIKSDYARHRQCLAHQRQVRERCDRAIFCVQCPYGVREQIVPIFRGQRPVGYLAVSTDQPQETVRTLLRPLAAMLAQVMEPAEQGQDKDLYRHILAVIHSNLDRKLTIEQIAERCYCSASMVSHLFRTRSGMPVNRYITAQKMNRAEQLLRQGSTIADTARQCGYEDANYFISVFKKHFGLPPGRYQKSRK